MNKSKNELFYRYSIVHKKNEEIDPDFDNYDCCKERPLCKSLKEWGMMYTRVEIEQMSAKLGYSIWDNIGGPDVKCQCKWKGFVVSKVLNEATFEDSRSDSIPKKGCALTLLIMIGFVITASISALALLK